MMTHHIYMHTHNYCVCTHTQTQGFAVTIGALWSFCLISWSIFGSIKKNPLLAVQSVRQISMVNLEKLLVAASGRLATTEENVQWSPPHQSMRKVSLADDEKANDHTESSRKLSISQLPPKRDLAILDNDDDCRSREGGIEDSNDEISELEMLPEACATERTDKNLRKILKKRMGRQREESSRKAHTQSLSCTKAERAEALAKLVKRRRDAASARRRSSQCSSVDKMDLPSANVHDSYLTLSNEEESSGNEMEFSSDEDSKSPEPPTLREIMEITVPRSKLVKWYMEPFFNELITGCFVRVLIGKGKAGAPVYRLCEVLNVDATAPNRQYEFENKTTCKYLNLVWGSGTPARWQMAVVSDSPPHKAEFDQWLREVKLNGGHMPTKQELLEKRQALEKTNSFVYSAAIVKQMVEEKRSAGWKLANVVAERVRLRRELELVNEDDDVELKRFKARLQELDAIRESSWGSRKKALMVEELNKKNLLENLNNESRKNVSSKSSKDYDPFTRRWTRPQSFFMASSSAVVADSPISTSSSPGNAAVEGKLVDTTAPMDRESGPNTLHDFEMHISLAVLEKFGGPRGARAGYLAMKQRREATLGFKVPEDDGKSHAHILSVDEYRIRRGLA